MECVHTLIYFTSMHLIRAKKIPMKVIKFFTNMFFFLKYIFLKYEI